MTVCSEHVSAYTYICVCMCLTLFLPLSVLSQHDVPAVLSPPRYGRSWNSCRLAPQSHWAILRCYSSVLGFVVEDIRWNFDVQGTHLEENALFFSGNNGENMTWKITVWKKEHVSVWKIRSENLESWVPTWKRSLRTIYPSGRKHGNIFCVYVTGNHLWENSKYTWCEIDVHYTHVDGKLFCSVRMARIWRPGGKC